MQDVELEGASSSVVPELAASILELVGLAGIPRDLLLWTGLGVRVQARHSVVAVLEV